MCPSCALRGDVTFGPWYENFDWDALLSTSLPSPFAAQCTDAANGFFAKKGLAHFDPVPNYIGDNKWCEQWALSCSPEKRRSLTLG